MPTVATQGVRPDYKASYVTAWSYNEAANYSGFTLKTLYNYVSNKKFITFKRGMYRVDRVSFERFLAGE